MIEVLEKAMQELLGILVLQIAGFLLIAVIINFIKFEVYRSLQKTLEHQKM
jgi:hypothetical protein